MATRKEATTVRALVLFCLVAFLVEASTSLGATAFMAPSSEIRGVDAIRFIAAPGETNEVTVSVGAMSDFDIVDPGATITPGSGCTSVDAHEVTCPRPGGDDPIVVRLGDGNDIVVLRYEDDGGGAYFGGPGNDRILGGGDPWSGEFLSGGPGNDLLRGRKGDDTLKGGGGSDVLSGGTSTACEFLGCFPNQDVVTYHRRMADVHAVADDVPNDGAAGEGDFIKTDVERIIGGYGNDVLGGETTSVRRFNDGVTVWLGMELRGGRGNDVLIGDRSGDFLRGGRGADVLKGHRGADALVGADGSDVLVGGPGHDDLVGKRGDDRLLARDGRRDHVDGGRGQDVARIDVALDRISRIERLL
jgi:Ca2+-binding RTX toxin-like protein